MRAPALEDGQLHELELGPGFRAALRLTAAGDVVIMMPPASPLTLSPADACTIGMELVAWSARGAKVREARKVRAAKRAAKRGAP